MINSYAVEYNDDDDDVEVVAMSDGWLHRDASAGANRRLDGPSSSSTSNSHTIHGLTHHQAIREDTWISSLELFVMKVWGREREREREERRGERRECE
jgi:hypothetical protein